MHRIILLLTPLLFAFNITAHGQEVKRRNGVLSLNGKPYLTYETTRILGVRIYAYHALGEEETLFQAHMCTNWSYQGGDSYRHYYFPATEQELILPSRRKYRFQLLLPKMVEAGVLDEDGNMNNEALGEFIAKYHVPLPPRFGRKVHQLPIIANKRSDSHRYKIVKDQE